MISALAARKAKAQTDSKTVSPSPVQLQESSEPSPVILDVSPRPPKRKLTPSGGNSSRNRKKKRKIFSSQRYFDANISSSNVGPSSRSPSPPTPGEESEGPSEIEEDEYPAIPLPGPSTLPDLERFKPVPRSRIFPGQESSSRIVVLQEGERLPLLGVYQFCVVYGTVSFYGAHISANTDKWIDVHAPSCAVIPSFSSIASEESCGTLPQSIPRDIVTSNSAILEIRPLKSHLPDILNAIIPIFKDVFTSSRLELLLEGVYLIHSLTQLPLLTLQPSWTPLLEQLPEQPATIHIVRGTRNCGKSTFARVMLNTLLNSYDAVAYLDTDLGQSEFTPSGFVGIHICRAAIFGPPFTHPTIPSTTSEGVAHYLGVPSPKYSPSSYLDTIQACVETYFESIRHPAAAVSSYPSRRRQYSTVEPQAETPPGSGKRSDIVPLIVNTHGWTKGLGLDLLRKIEESLVQFLPFTGSGVGSTKPPDVKVYDLTPPPRHAFPFSFSHAQGQEENNAQGEDEEQFDVIKLQPYDVPFNSSKRPTASAANLRNLMLMSYFYPPSSSSEIPHTAIPLPLSCHPPYIITPSQVLNRAILTGPGSEDVVQEEIGRVLVGALVGIVVDEQEAFSPHERTQGEKAKAKGLQSLYTPNSPIPDPRTSRCIGLGFIRSVAPSLISGQTQEDEAAGDDGAIHLLTPIPLAAFQNQKLTLVKGENDMCIWGWLPPPTSLSSGGSGEQQQGTPFLQYVRTESLGSNKRKVRRGLMRKSQM
ncbi:hypothetical protein DL96DRAFT_1703802 [Flagelloscypha sp. PMI_526]|nr:hypothetical protein DL96DRAFT_1703802 [Flagelloscypha sp. PMI_526]